MLMIVALVFVGAFAVAALLLLAPGSSNSRQAKQAMAALDSALAAETPQARDQMLDLRKKDLLSGIPWLNRKLVQSELSPLLHRLLQQADLKWTAGTLIFGSAVCFAIPAYLLNLKFGSLLLSLAIGLVLGSAPLAFVLFKRSKRFNKFQQALPEALELMVGALRAGHSLIAAMGLVSRECPDPVGSEFKVCFDEQNYGLELKAALDNMVTRIPLQDLRIVSTAIMIQKESGGNLAEVLDKTAHVIRERFRLKRQVGVHTAQGRLTGWILGLLPIGLGIVLYFADPKMTSLLWRTELGLKMLWGACILMVLGGLAIRHIVNMDV